MSVLLVKKLDERATLPTVAHPGEDLAYDVYALEDCALENGVIEKVHTGVAVAGFSGLLNSDPCGFVIKDRSSMAAKQITTHGGVIDPGYRGEIVVLLKFGNGSTTVPYFIRSGDKIAQLIPTPVNTGAVIEAHVLPESARGEKAFGSSGK